MSGADSAGDAVSEQRGWPYEPVDTAAPPPPVDPQPVALSVADPARGPEPPGDAGLRPRALIGLVVVMTVAVLLSAFAFFDWFSRNQELEVMLDRIERAEASQHPAALRPLMRDCYLSTSVCDTGAIARVATRALPELRSTGDAVAKMRLPRHHGALRDLRDRYVEHNLAWQAWFSSLARGVTEIEAPYEISTTWSEVGVAAHRAVPPLPLHDARGRVAEIFDH